MMLMGINILFGLSFYVPFRAGQFNFGVTAFIALGAYISSVLTMKFGVPLWLAVIISGLTVGLIGTVVIMPAMKLREIYLALSSIGFLMIITVLIENWSYVGGVNGLTGMTGTTLLLVWVTVFVLFTVTWYIDNSLLGKVMFAITNDENIIPSFGINIVTIRLFTFAWGAFIAGIAGALYAHLMLFISMDNFTTAFSINIVLMVILGGIQTVWGPVVGAIIMTLLPVYIKSFEDYQMILFSAIIILLMTITGKGLVTRQLIRRIRFRELVRKGMRSDVHETSN